MSEPLTIIIARLCCKHLVAQTTGETNYISVTYRL